MSQPTNAEAMARYLGRAYGPGCEARYREFQAIARGSSVGGTGYRTPVIADLGYEVIFFGSMAEALRATGQTKSSVCAAIREGVELAGIRFRRMAK